MSRAESPRKFQSRQVRSTVRSRRDRAIERPSSRLPNSKTGKPSAETEATPVGRFLTSSAPLAYFPPNPHKDGTTPEPVYVTSAREIARKPPPPLQKMRFYVPFPKRPGGSHAGCFGKFPEYTGDPYTREKDKIAAPKFISAGPSARSKYTSSIIDQITRVSCNARNYAEYRERAYPLRQEKENCSLAQEASRI